VHVIVECLLIPVAYIGCSAGLEKIMIFNKKSKKIRFFFDLNHIFVI